MIVDARLVVAGNDVRGRGKHLVDNALIEWLVGHFQALCHLHTQGITKLDPLLHIAEIEEVVVAQSVLVRIRSFQGSHGSLYIGVNLLIHRCTILIYALLIEVITRCADALTLCAESLGDGCCTISVEHAPLLIAQQDLGDSLDIGIALSLAALGDARIDEVVEVATKRIIIVRVSQVTRLRVLIGTGRRHIASSTGTTVTYEILHIDHRAAIQIGQMGTAAVVEVEGSTRELVTGIYGTHLLRVGVQVLILVQTACEQERRAHSCE